MLVASPNIQKDHLSRSWINSMMLDQQHEAAHGAGQDVEEEEVEVILVG